MAIEADGVRKQAFTGPLCQQQRKQGKQRRTFHIAVNVNGTRLKRDKETGQGSILLLLSQPYSHRAVHSQDASLQFTLKTRVCCLSYISGEKDPGGLAAFPAELSQADKEYLFLAKLLRLSPLTPSHVLNLKHYPKLVRREARLVCLEATIAALENPDLFELNLLAKLWFASLGTYTALDAAAGRQFLCGPFSFTAMHELRLRVSERPHHGALTMIDTRASAVVRDRYTDPPICDVYDTLRRAAAAGYPPPLPLANIFDLPQFRAVLEPFLRAGTAELPLMLARMRDKAVALRRTINMLRLSLGPPEAPLDDPTGGPPGVPPDDPEAAGPVAAVEWRRDCLRRLSSYHRGSFVDARSSVRFGTSKLAETEEDEKV
ncbi:hypothetical protein B0T26DRAFT_669433 [Lasiosphaeria miniovina]|uniref:Uncharacterized protein n=1 Tax=Lasiosphaeria miniovina TaxID=1954250 RepID=A0AA40BEW5_9PEZI|nr:uncharacterized protein B0T26DRAFT_669433 [Lasiosphaeria miniovina]KAK0732975.1 hypothetical protein B0T26DRAFT_669433 [Lasiosphaeria miniovina]